MNRKFKFVSDGIDPKNARTLDELMGVRKELNYPFKNVSELEAHLKTLNMLDMQNLAVDLGIKPNMERPRLVRACMEQFVRLTKTYGAAKQVTKASTNFDPSSF